MRELINSLAEFRLTGEYCIRCANPASNIISHLNNKKIVANGSTLNLMGSSENFAYIIDKEEQTLKIKFKSEEQKLVLKGMSLSAMDYSGKPTTTLINFYEGENLNNDVFFKQELKPAVAT